LLARTLEARNPEPRGSKGSKGSKVPGRRSAVVIRVDDLDL
jgi:hypothetical protein